jgi:cell division protein FtsN
MSNKPALRFDHREIAVVFSLFVFVALLMFTVGILVGKGIAQAKFDAAAGAHGGAVALPVHEPKLEPIAGEHEEIEEAHKVPPSAKNEASHEDHELVQKAADVPPLLAAKPEKKEDELELIPLGPQKTDWNGMSLRNQPPNDDTKKLLQNPKIEALTEKGTGASRQTAAIGSTDKEGLSFSNGTFTVQVGSYPNQKDAEERVKALKGLGFAHAYLSAKDLGDSNGTWFRVWLGYFPTYEAAKKSGDKLQARGEVKNYLVRKAELENGTN